MHDRIEIDPRIHHGQPVIKGTRVPLTRILAEVAAGTSFEHIQQQYDVTPEDITVPADERGLVLFRGDSARVWAGTVRVPVSTATRSVGLVATPFYLAIVNSQARGADRLPID